jgi:hypothetical protein
MTTLKELSQEMLLQQNPAVIVMVPGVVCVIIPAACRVVAEKPPPANLSDIRIVNVLLITCAVTLCC